MTGTTYHYESRRHGQRGMASIIITLITMIIISLIVLGFATAARREQRQSLDQQLSAQAFYAAETGIEDARKIIESDLQNGGLIEKDDCKNNGPGGTYPSEANGRMVIDAANEVSYTCLLVKANPGSLQYDGVGTGDVVVPITTNGNMSDLRITWAPETAPPAGATPQDCPNGTANVLAPQSGWDCYYGLLRLDMVPSSGALSRTGLNNGAMTAFLVPQRNGGSASMSYTGSIGRSNIVNADCDTGSYGECEISIGGLGTSTGFMLRLSSLYRTSNIRITAMQGGNPIGITGAQAVVDVTGKARDVLRRIQVRIPLTVSSNQSLPGRSVQSSGAICKRFASINNYLRIPADIHTDNRDPGNAMCAPYTDGSQ